MEIKWYPGTFINFNVENNIELEPITLHDLTKLRSYCLRRCGSLMLKPSVAAPFPNAFLSGPLFPFGKDALSCWTLIGKYIASTVIGIYFGCMKKVCFLGRWQYHER